MALTIKNPEADRRARELARLQGTTITRAVIIALEAALDRVRGRATARSRGAAMLDISDRCAALPDLDRRGAEAILGYDDQGTLA